MMTWIEMVVVRRVKAGLHLLRLRMIMINHQGSEYHIEDDDKAVSKKVSDHLFRSCGLYGPYWTANLIIMDRKKEALDHNNHPYQHWLENLSG